LTVEGDGAEAGDQDREADGLDVRAREGQDPEAAQVVEHRRDRDGEDPDPQRSQLPGGREPWPEKQSQSRQEERDRDQVVGRARRVRPPEDGVGGHRARREGR
jgi:hypothetical protein